jgi:ParB family chromosome partitioning protein
MTRKRITSTLGQAAKAFAGSANRADTEVPPEEPEAVLVAKRGRDLLSAMAGTIHTVTILEVPPKRCKMWVHHNRFYHLLDADTCSDLIESFKTQGQIHPAIVRKCLGDPDHDYEVICGARRHWTATYLKRDLLVEVRDLSDEDAFLIADAENRDSKDISDYERALEYGRALELFYEGNQTAMAAKIGIPLPVLSHYLALAEMDKVLVDAYPDPRWIKVHHAVTIRPLWKKPPSRAKLTARAKQLADASTEKRPKEGAAVFRALMSALKGDAGKRRTVVRSYAAKEGGRKMLTVRWYSTGKIGVEIDRRSGATIEEILSTLSGALNESS